MSRRMAQPIKAVKGFVHRSHVHRRRWRGRIDGFAGTDRGSAAEDHQIYQRV